MAWKHPDDMTVDVATKCLAGSFLDLSAKINKDAENGVDVDLEDYSSLQQIGEQLANKILED